MFSAHIKASQSHRYKRLCLVASCFGALACASESAPATEPASGPQKPVSIAESALVSGYPGQAPHILNQEHDPLTHSSPLFKLSVELPAFGENGVTLLVKDADPIIVHEEGLSGERIHVNRTAAYTRPDGFVYWTYTDTGMEEWLLIEPGQAYAHQPVAKWTLQGASVRAQGELLEIIPKSQGQAAIWVHAPVAYTQSGQILKPWLTSPAPDRIELYVDARGEGVLIDPSWKPTTTMIVPRDSCETAVLADGRILVTGGNIEHNPPTTMAELFEPITQTWKPGGTMIYPAVAHTATTLASGWVLVAGGYYIQYTMNGADYAFPPKAQLYQPSTNTWSMGGTMLSPRFAHSATLLPNGKVLIAGGISAATNSYLNGAEIYDPSVNLFKPAAPMLQAKAGHAAALLPTGKVLVTGGEIPGGEPYAGAEIYDPALNTWKAAAPMNKVRKDHRMVLLPNGKILAAGTLSGNGAPNDNPEPGDAELYDPNLNQWTPTGLMASQALLPSLTLMGNQKVLLTAEDSVQKANTAQVYDPAADLWTEAKPLQWERKSRRAERLPDGKVLVLCGTPTGNPNPIPFAEIYDPGMFYGNPCQGPSDCESGFCVDGVCCNSACGAGPCDACSVQAGATADGVCTLLSGAICDDDNLCTSDDRCNAGVCTGTPIECTPADPCHKPGSCNPGTGLCANPTLEDGASCGTDQICEAGQCVMASSGTSMPQPPPDGEPGTGGCNCSLIHDTPPRQTVLLWLLGLGMALSRRKRSRF